MRENVYFFFFGFTCFCLFARCLLFQPQDSPAMREQRQGLIRRSRLWRRETLLRTEELRSQKHDDGPRSLSHSIIFLLDARGKAVAGKNRRAGRLVRCPGGKVPGRRKMFRRWWRAKCSRRCFYKVVYELLGLHASCSVGGPDRKQHTKVFGNHSSECITP